MKKFFKNGFRLGNAGAKIKKLLTVQDEKASGASED